MTLSAPRLDDRTFQQIVDEAKRRIHRLCPEWTDHNVSDPGVTLIELYAWMTEMILYRMNQVPDRLYVKFLELIGVELYGSAPAVTDLLFTLTAPQPEKVIIPAGTQVSTEQVGDEEPIVFMTDEKLEIAPPKLISCVTRSGEQYEEQFDDLRLAAARVVCFRSLRPGDAFYLGFADSLAANLVRLHIVTGIEGAGVRPEQAPLRWESWTGERWVAARDPRRLHRCPELPRGWRHHPADGEPAAADADWAGPGVLAALQADRGRRGRSDLPALARAGVGGRGQPGRRGDRQARRGRAGRTARHQQR